MDTQPPPIDDAQATLRRQRLVWLWALATPLLIGATWPLWCGRTALPSIPALSLLTPAPMFAEYVLLGAVAWGTLCVVRGKQAAGLAYGCVGLAGLMLFDQLRWQPWAYHLLVMGSVLLLSPPWLAVALLRVLAVSVYLYSAIAKLDFAFASTLGRQMLEAAAGLVGLEIAGWPRWLLLSLALAMPVAEAVAGLLLAWRRTRTAGLLLAIFMHLSAFVALGPLGLNHRPGVLLWNLVFPAHLWLLFGPIKSAAGESLPAEPSTAVAPRWSAKVAIAIVGFAVMGPLTRPLGVWDRWPSWGLYAPGGERTEVLVRASVLERLPDTLRADEVDESSGDAGWRRLRLDEWSLDQSLAPLYPQRRTTLAIVRELDRAALLGGALRVELLSAADRFSGERSSESLHGIAEVEEYARRYWLNTRTRTLPSPARR
ncbi:hypothetical protein KOR34_05990 [Posidoniimonas corsicana]|uniref:Vitamin K-dependent gamma-carboxylase n=1 Tax=Posidoniimonas corsicana TaxID=1938618 RepID=A0A5C5VDI0_9BACT|nr:hypothetical protein [Posidoniimonas corsicana]TWT35705.1 hypothetical protein KOR34_05990 [Posidoniimonas corsicana]